MLVTDLQPADETKRIAAVRRYDILDTPPERAFDRITALAARRFGMPISVISIVDTDRIWFKSHHGLEAEQISREVGLSASVIVSDVPWVLTDARHDVRSLTNPLVTGEFGLRFYAGVPLRSADGHNLGTLCVIDTQPRSVSAGQIEDLQDLASLVMDQLELRLSARNAVARAQVLSREIDHRVMNSLQFITSMLRMQGRASGHSEVASHLQIAANRVNAVARVHQHFHVVEGSSEQVDCLSYLRRLCSDLSDILATEVTVEGCAALVSTLQIQPIGLIVNELVTNAAKHGRGRIAVTFRAIAGKDFCLVVANRGEIVGDDFDPAATSTGLGMTLVSVLAQQLGGSFIAGPNPAGGGAIFTVTFPAND